MDAPSVVVVVLLLGGDRRWFFDATSAKALFRRERGFPPLPADAVDDRDATECRLVLRSSMVMDDRRLREDRAEEEEKEEVAAETPALTAMATRALLTALA